MSHAPLLIVYPRLFQFGSIAIPTSGVLTAIGVIAALFVARGAARRLQIDSERVWDLGMAGLLTGLLAPRLILFAVNWRDFVAHPLWMLGILSIRSQTAVIAGTALAIAVMLFYARLARLPLRRTLDALAPAFALGLALSNLGAFASGAEFGIPSTLPWAVVYTSRLASLWNHTPLGTPLHPVQMYAALIGLCLFAALLAMIAGRDRRRLRDGEVMGAWLFLQGVSSFLLSLLRGDLLFAASESLWTIQIASGAMVLAGGLLWLL